MDIVNECTRMRDVEERMWDVEWRYVNFHVAERMLNWMSKGLERW